MQLMIIFGVIALAVLATAVYAYLHFFSIKTKSATLSHKQPFKMVAITPEDTPDLSSQDWTSQMQNQGLRLGRLGIKQVIFINGTFVGNDPFDFFKLAGSLLPDGLEDVISTLQNFYLDRKHLVWRDKIFDHSYLNLFSQTTNLNASLSEWSSGNYHFARLLGLINLLYHLQKIEATKERRILFVAHSHGGQILALLSQVLRSSKLRRIFLQLGDETGASDLEKYICELAQIKMDFVTLGTPVRYRFAKWHKLTLLHIVNHRGIQPLNGNFSGIFTARDGDYIQQLGIAGSDLISPIKKHATLSTTLEPFLGEGFNLHAWQKGLKKPFRLAPQGFNLLVDYQDDTLLPTSFSKLFGHVVYIQKKYMLFNLTQIADFLEKKNL